MPLKARFFFALFFIVYLQHVAGQAFPATDTLVLTVAGAETLFLQNNFSLLAAKYNIGEAEAAIIQAKLYPNPALSIGQGGYNPDTKKSFDFGRNGETTVSVQQLILMAGKRNKQVNLAKINSRISGYQFYDLLRTLRYELRSSFYALYFLREPVAVYDREIESISTLVKAYSDQYDKGNIAFKEIARLQALLFSLQNERLDLLKQAAEKQADLRLITGDTLLRPVKPVVEQDIAEQTDVSRLRIADLLDSASANRYDLLAANAQVQLNEADLALQKSLRTPDISVGLNYDKAGSYVRNYNSVSLGIDLPLWNRNEGNIQAARLRIDESKQLVHEASLQIKNSIVQSYSRLAEADKLYKTASVQFTAGYEKLLDGITRGYQNHTISLLEFIDYYETYKNSKLEFNRLQNNRLDALENLHLETGTFIFK